MRRFASAFDEALATTGPPAIFTRDPEGKLRVDPERTREAWLLVGDPGPVEAAHFVLADRATGLRLYLFVTHPALAMCQPRGDVARYTDDVSAVAAAMEQWAPGPAPRGEREEL